MRSSPWWQEGVPEQFEAAAAELFGARRSVAVCNGTAALHVALSALDLQPGDEVLNGLWSRPYRSSAPQRDCDWERNGAITPPCNAPRHLRWNDLPSRFEG